MAVKPFAQGMIWVPAERIAQPGAYDLVPGNALLVLVAPMPSLDSLQPMLLEMRYHVRCARMRTKGAQITAGKEAESLV